VTDGRDNYRIRAEGASRRLASEAQGHQAQTEEAGEVMLFQHVWTVACPVCLERAGSPCRAPTTWRLLSHGHTRRIRAQRQWDIAHALKAA